MAWRGKFTPKNPQKYKGDITKIVYRSRIELTFMKYIDENPNILEYASEEFSIPYISPVDNKPHRYFPDIWLKKMKTDGTIEINVIELKHTSETGPPKTPKKRTRRYLQEVKTWGVNSAKWKAAELYCKARGWVFLTITEKDLGIRYGKFY